MKNTTTVHRIWAVTVAIVIFFSLWLSGAGVVCAADTTSDVVAAFENRNVMDDLQNAEIDGEVINLNDYNFDERKNTQLLNFVELCYSFYTDNQQDYGLYIYVYNPCGLDFTQNPELNQIEMRVGGDTSKEFNKYSLRYLNRSEISGYEGLFYKFKIELTASQRAEILLALNSSERIYEVSGVELYSAGVNAVDYEVSIVYTYTGYAKGYGSISATEDTLNCICDNFNLTLSLDVHSTFYRPEGTNGGFKSCTQDTLHSVYFSVPNKVTSEYGEMKSVHATWLNALTDIMLITGNIEIYHHMLDYIGIDTGQDWNEYWNDEVNYAFITEYEGLSGYPGDLEGGDIAYNPAMALQGTSYNGINGYDGYNRLLTQLDYIFYAMDGDADNYRVSSDKILEWLKKYTAIYGGNLVNGKYSSELFEKVDDKVTDIVISADDTYTLISEKYTVEWYNTYLYNWFGAYSDVKTTTYNVNAIQSVTLTDMDKSLSEKSFCNKFYVDEHDYDELYSYVKAAESNNETVYLFRYYQSDYWAAEVTECEPNNYTNNKIDSNAYFAQEWVQLDFDIIDLTFIKDDVSTVIPVIMSPMDIAIDTRPPIKTGEDKPNILLIIITVIIAIVLIIVFIKCFPSVVSLIGQGIIALFKWLMWIISAPFKLIQTLYRRRQESADERIKRKTQQLQRKANLQRLKESKEDLKEQEEQLKMRQAALKQSAAARKIQSRADKLTKYEEKLRHSERKRNIKNTNRKRKKNGKTKANKARQKTSNRQQVALKKAGKSKTAAGKRGAK